MTTIGSDRNKISTAALASLGDGRVAYVRTLLSEDAATLFPNAPDMAPGHTLWALLSADGTPIVLSDNPQAVLTNAMENNLVTVSVH